MWQFLCGFSAGMYLGTYYNCRPTINQFMAVVADLTKNFPRKEGHGGDEN